MARLYALAVPLAAMTLAAVSACRAGGIDPGGPSPAAEDGSPSPVTDDAGHIQDATSPHEVGVPSKPLPPYGSRTFVIDARSYGTNSELFLKAGQQAVISAAGSWSMWGGVLPATGPEGSPTDLYNGCPYGSLVAQIGLHWKGKLHCVGKGGTVTADRDGILFLKANDGGCDDNAGSMTVTVSSNAARSPVIPRDLVAATDLSNISADWIELAGTHVLLTLPKALVSKYQKDAAKAIAAFDGWYYAQALFVSAMPYNGDRVRFFPDETLSGGIWMLAGNPVRFNTGALDGPPGGSRILQSHDHQFSVWGFSHELGHNFTIDVRHGLYMVGSGPTEAWANVVNIRSLEATGYPEGTLQRPLNGTDMCQGLPQYLASGSYNQLRADAWLPLCMFFEIKNQYGGWPLFEKFFYNYVHKLDLSTVPPTSASDGVRWRWLRDQLNMHSGKDTTPTFTKYKIPLS